MASFRSRMSVYLPILVIMLGMMGLLGFQMLNERKASSALLEDKEAEILRVHGELQKAMKKSDGLRHSNGKLNTEKANLNTQLVGLKKQLEELEQNLSSSEKEKKTIESDLQGKKKELNNLKQRVIKLENNEKEVKILQNELVKLEGKLRSEEAQHAELVKKSNKERSESISELQKEIERLKAENAQTAENLRIQLLKKDLQKPNKENETLVTDATLQNSEKGTNVVNQKKDEVKMKETTGATNSSKPIQKEKIKLPNGKESQSNDSIHVEDVKDDSTAVIDPTRGEVTQPGEDEKDENIKISDLDEDRPETDEQVERQIDADNSKDETIGLEDGNEDADGGVLE